MAASGKVLEITDANFEAETLKATTPVLLDFTAEWCQPCKAMAPMIAERAAEYTGKVTVGSVDIGKHLKVATHFQIRNVPTLILVSGGKVLGALNGAHPRARIVDLLKKAQ